MGDTAIGWTHRPGTRGRTWNPTKGCSRVSEGCRHCYAEQQAARIVRMGKGRPTPYDDLVKLVNGEARWTGKVNLVPDVLVQPMRWRQPSTIFVNSMSDLFHESLSNEKIAAVFGVMAVCTQHTFQCLTKRARRMREWYAWLKTAASLCGLTQLALCIKYGAEFAPFSGPRPGVSAEVFDRIRRDEWPLPNVWIGVSCENQDAADERIPDLLSTPAAVHYLSCEPLLGPLDVSGWLHWCTSCVCSTCPPHHDAIDAASRSSRCHLTCDRGVRVGWVIDGCESGPGARPAEQAWFESLRDQCKAAGVPWFHKQMMVDGKLRTDPAEMPDGLQSQEWPA